MKEGVPGKHEAGKQNEGDEAQGALGQIGANEQLATDPVTSPLAELGAEEGCNHTTGHHQGNSLAGMARVGSLNGSESVIVGEALVVAEQKMPGNENGKRTFM